MAALRVLFIGGTGTISSASAKLAVERGIELSVLNRGQTSTRSLPESATLIRGDIRDTNATRQALAGQEFDVVVDFVAYLPEHVQADIDLFSGRVGQYVFISSASAYQKPVQHLPITESTPLVNPFWEYSRNKIACEDLLIRAHRESGFPATIVRPSHTYDRTRTPFSAGWAIVERMRQGKEVPVHGDGTSLWTLTHTDDYARAFVGLLGNSRAVGDTFHITSDDVLTWDQIHRIMGTAAGVPDANLIHLPSEVFAEVYPEWGPGLLGDKAFSVVFDNAKVKALVPDYVATIPYEQGAAQIVEWFDADPARKAIDPAIDAALDRLTEIHRAAMKG